MDSMVYVVEGTDQKVILCSSVIEQVTRYRQICHDAPESGGQLFAHITSSEIVISCATVPYKEDRRSRFRLTLDRWRQKLDIRQLFSKGLHFVGEWHTHPENYPSPSEMDLANMRECFVKSKHQLHSFLMMIVGTDTSEKGIWLSQHNESICKRLQFFGSGEGCCREHSQTTRTGKESERRRKS